MALVFWLMGLVVDMGDLVKRLRMREAAVSAKLKPSKFDAYDTSLDKEAAERIDQLESEIAIKAILRRDFDERGQIIARLERDLAEAKSWKRSCEIATSNMTVMSAQLTAEKALADRLAGKLKTYVPDGRCFTLAAHRKARGL